jgi:hypothetical protein
MKGKGKEGEMKGNKRQNRECTYKIYACKAIMLMHFLKHEDGG